MRYFTFPSTVACLAAEWVRGHALRWTLPEWCRTAMTIVEDDVVLGARFDENLQAAWASVEHLVGDAWILFLGTGSNYVRPKRWVSDWVFVPSQTVGFHAYVVSPAAARIILGDLFPLQQAIDSQFHNSMDALATKGLQILAIASPASVPAGGCGSAHCSELNAHSSRRAMPILQFRVWVSWHCVDLAVVALQVVH